MAGEWLTSVALERSALEEFGESEDEGHDDNNVEEEKRSAKDKKNKSTKSEKKSQLKIKRDELAGLDRSIPPPLQSR